MAYSEASEEAPHLTSPAILFTENIFASQHKAKTFSPSS
jgi:hypothetical protein